MTEAEFLAQYMLPDDERKRLLIGNALLGLGSGLMQAKRGGELTNAGLGLFAGAQQGQNAIADAQRGQVDKFKLKQMWQEGEDKKAQRAAQAALSQRLTEAGNPTAGMPSLAPTNENVARIPKSYEVAMRQWQIATDAGDLRRAEEYRKAAEFLREKYGLDPKLGIDPQTNQPYQFVLSESGTEKRLNAGAPPKFREVNRGGTVDIVNEYNLPTTGQSFAKTLTPEGVQSGKQWEADYGLRRNADQRAADAAKRANEVKPQWDAGSGQFVYAPTEKNPTGQAITPAGFAKPDKPLTESQAKATAYVNMMENANRDLAALSEKGFTGSGEYQQAQINNAGGEGIPYLPGTGMLQRGLGASDDAQKYYNAQLQWTEPVLRFQTGANAPKEEVIRNAATYFPRPGDSDEVIAQKANARAAMEESMRLAAGSGSARVPQSTPGTGGGPVKIKGDADFAALPSGTEFIGPDGKRRRKP